MRRYAKAFILLFLTTLAINIPAARAGTPLRIAYSFAPFHYLDPTPYRGNGWHKKHVESLEVTTVESSSITNIWQMLQRKRGDLVIEWPKAAIPHIQRPWLTGQILDTRIIPAEKPFHLMIRNSPVHVTILNDFNLTIEAMRCDGTLKSILARYR